MQATATHPIHGHDAALPPEHAALPVQSRALRVGDTVARVLLGLAFFVFGLDGFLHFFPMPDPSEIPVGAAELGAAMASSGYLLKLVKGTEVLVGALLLANRFVPLALTVLAPVTVNILFFHAVLAPSGLVLPIVLTGLQLFMALAATRRVPRAATSPGRALSGAPPTICGDTFSRLRCSTLEQALPRRRRGG